MSRVVRYKHFMKEMMADDFDLPTATQQIVRVISSRGNNLHEVESAQPNAENFLVSMPNKYRKNVWVKRGDYILVEPIEEGDKVKAEICKILTPEHIKEYTKANVWPKKFTRKREHSSSDEMDAQSDDDGGFMVRNRNRLAATEVAASTEGSEEESDSDNNHAVNGDNIQNNA